MRVRSNKVVIFGESSPELEEFQAILGDSGFEIIRVFGELGLERLPEPDIEVIFLATGREERISPEFIGNHPGIKNIPIVILAFRENKQEKKDYYRAGARDYLVYPWDEDEIIAKTGYYLTAGANRKRLKETEQLLETQRQQYRVEIEKTESLLDSLPVCLALFKVDRDGIWHNEYRSPSSQEIYGFDGEDMKRDRDVWFSRVHPEDLAMKILPSLTRINRGETFTVEYRLSHPNGETRWIADRVFSQKEESTGEGKIIIVGVDITEQKSLETSLKKSREQLDNVINDSHACLFSLRVYDRDTWEYDYYSNACEELFGYTSKDMTDNPQLWLSKVFHEDRQNFIEELFQNIFNQNAYEFEYRFCHRDGSIKWIVKNISSRWNEDFKCWVVTGSNLDITKRKTLEISLQESESKLNDILNNSLACIFRIKFKDSKIWEYEYFSRASEYLLGYTPQELMADPLLWMSKVHEDDREALIKKEVESITEGKPYTYEYRFLHKDNRIRWFRGSLTSKWDERLYCHIVTGFDTDITETKELELQVLESERKYRSLVENMSDGIYILSNTFDLLYINDSVSRILGASLEYLQEQPIVNFLRCIHPEDIALIDNSFKDIDNPSDIRELNYRVIRPSGEIRYVRDTYHIVRSASGDIDYYQGIITDITPLKQAEIALKKSQEQLESVINYAKVGLWEWNMKTDEVYWNKVNFELLGCREGEEKAGYEFWKRKVYEEDRERILKELEIAIREGREIHLEYRVIHPDGSIRWLIDKARIVLDANGEQEKMIGVKIDITERKEIEEALREKERRLRETQRIANLGNWRYNIALDEINWSEEMYSIFGIEPNSERLTYDRFLNMLVPEDQEIIEEKVRETLLHGISYEIEHRIIRPDGEIRYLYGRGEAIRDKEGKTIEIIGTGLDITERKELEIELRRLNERLEEQVIARTEELARSEKRARIIFEQAAVGMVEVDIDESFTAVNQKFCDITGYTEKEILGKSCGDFTYCDDRGRERVAVEGLIRGDYNYCTFEKRYVRKDGALIWMNITVSLIRDANGQPDYFIAVMEDITEKKRTQQALEESENFFRSVVECNMLGIALWDKTEITYANDALLETIGYTREEVKLNPLNWQNLTPPEYREKDEYAYSETLEKGYCTPYEKEYIRKDDSRVPILLGGGHIRGDKTRGAFFALDISRLKAAEAEIKSLVSELESRVEQRTEELRQSLELAESANLAKTTFLANMSHELRTPLNAILGFSQLLSRDISLSETCRAQLNIINTSGENLLSLINDILAMSKIEAGKIEVENKPFDIQGLIDHIQQLFNLKAFRKGLDLKSEIAPNVPRCIIADENKLRQVLINLVGNAIKFTNEGSVSVKIDYRDFRLYVTVIDTGIGIHEENIDRVFNPFEQLNSRANLQEGTGLGLAIGKKFVQIMGGELKLTSQIDRGSTFFFDIPIVIHHNSIVESDNNLSHHKNIKISPDMVPPTILVVEDDPANRQLIVQILELAGFEVCKVGNGKNALEVWRNWQPALILLDKQLPDVNGSEVVRQIRSFQRELSPVPCKIIALTASVFEDDRREMLENGCDDFIAKPFKQSELLDKIARHIEVKYIYENTEPRSNLEHLTPAMLEGMPVDWLLSFSRGCLEANAERLYTLTDSLPAEKDYLKNQLREKVENYDFDQMWRIVSIALKNSGYQEPDPG